MSRKDPENPRKQATPAERRQQRLAEALRANLKRRKAGRPPAKPDTIEKPADSKD